MEQTPTGPDSQLEEERVDCQTELTFAQTELNRLIACQIERAQQYSKLMTQFEDARIAHMNMINSETTVTGDDRKNVAFALEAADESLSDAINPDMYIPLIAEARAVLAACATSFASWSS
jgi:hypothetical protein